MSFGRPASVGGGRSRCGSRDAAGAAQYCPRPRSASSNSTNARRGSRPCSVSSSEGNRWEVGTRGGRVRLLLSLLFIQKLLVCTGCAVRVYWDTSLVRLYRWNVVHVRIAEHTPHFGHHRRQKLSVYLDSGDRDYAEQCGLRTTLS